jgi:hypothetical protein
VPSKVRVKSNLKGLEQLQKNLKTNLVAKVGVFGDDNNRGDGLTNSEVGAAHEFGVLSDGIPRRSFLRDPIQLKRKRLLKEAQGIIKANIVKEDGAQKIFELIGIMGEAIVQEAFETGGFGAWEPLSDKTIAKKKSESILIDTSQLRGSITSKAEKR